MDLNFILNLIYQIYDNSGNGIIGQFYQVLILINSRIYKQITKKKKNLKYIQ